MHFLKQPFIQKFKGDFSENPLPRQTPEYLFCLVKPCGFPNFQLLHFNQKLAYELGFPKDFIKANSGFLAGNLTNISTYATAYAGHQFGQWAGQLGDGRAILAGEISNKNNQYNELQWKGAGTTPYSRTADGMAVLRSSVREYLMSEAMHHLGISTTRALSLCLTGEKVLRDPLYNGNLINENGAVVMRSAPSFLRFGHLELLMAQQKIEELKLLLDWVILRYYPEIEEENKYKAFYQIIANKTMKMLVNWQRVGFVHGVMNTDNFSLLGLTIDYGPFSFLDEFDSSFTPNTSDRNNRYSYQNQCFIGRWNLTALANALMPIVNDLDFFETELTIWEQKISLQITLMKANKLGFENINPTITDSIKLTDELMFNLKFDFTSFYIYLEKYLMEKFAIENWQKIAYKTLETKDLARIKSFLNEFEILVNKNQHSLALMQKNNPKFVLRNFMLQECIELLENGDLSHLNELFDALQNPYTKQEKWTFDKAPDWSKHTFGAGKLSCSS